MRPRSTRGSARSSAPNSGLPTAWVVHPAAAAHGRSRSPKAGCSRSCRGQNTRPLPLPGRGKARQRAGASTRSAKGSRARCRKPCARSVCARPATAAWPRQACNMQPLPRRSTSTAWQLGSQAGPLRLPAHRALPASQRDGRIRHQCPTVCGTRRGPSGAVHYQGSACPYSRPAINSSAFPFGVQGWRTAWACSPGVRLTDTGVR